MKLKIRSPREWADTINKVEPEDVRKDLIKKLRYLSYNWQYLSRYKNTKGLERLVLKLDFYSCLEGIKLYKKEHKKTKINNSAK